MSRLIDAYALIENLRNDITGKNIIRLYNLDEFIDAQPTVDSVPWEFLERYAEWFCATVSFPEFIREAKKFYLDAERYERWCNK